MEELEAEVDNRNADPNTMSLEDGNHLLSQTNPSRVPQGIFLQIPGVIAAIEEEINMLAKPDEHGIPELQVVEGSGAEFRHLGKLLTIVVVER